METTQRKYKLVPFLSSGKIQSMCKNLAEQINKDYQKYTVKTPDEHVSPQIVAICILKGGLFFIADTLRHINIPFFIDFVKLSSYGKETKSSGTVTLVQDIDINVTGKHVIIFEEIVDSGKTLTFYINKLAASKPASIKVCTLIDKKTCRHPESNVAPDYFGMVADKEFLVGYGLDHAEQYRNLPDIYQLKELN